MYSTMYVLENMSLVNAMLLPTPKNTSSTSKQLLLHFFLHRNIPVARKTLTRCSGEVEDHNYICDWFITILCVVGENGTLSS